MNKEELIKRFEENVNYLKRSIPPDDIYMFAEQTLMASLYFISKWNKCIDLQEECDKDPVSKKWVTNILGFIDCRDRNEEIMLDLNYPD